MNRLFRLTNIFVLCCVSLFLFGVHTNVGQCGLVERVPLTASWEPGTDTWLKLPRYATLSEEPFALKPARASQVYHPSAFNVFLPPSRTENVIGDAWSFDARRMLPFLRQFHPGATISLSGQQGAYACLRAVSPEYYEIVFQFHADFNLEMPKEIEGLTVENETFTGLKESVDEAFAELKQEQDILQQSVEEEFVGLKAQDLAVAAAERQQIEEAIAGLRKERKVELDTADDLADLKKELAETVASLTKITTSLEGLSGDLETRLNELKTTITALEDIVSNLESRLDELEKTLTAHFDAKLDELEKTLTAHFDARIHELKTELTANLESRLDALETELSAKLEAELELLINVITARENTLTERFNALLSAEIAKLKGTQAYNEGLYLKPKQFTGRLLISKDGKEIIAFTLKCPPHEGNATLFVFGDTETVSMSRMELIYSGNIAAKKTNITWTDAITAEQADEILRSKFASRMSQTENPIETQ